MPVPIPTLHLLPAIDQQLIQLLKNLSNEDWQRPTIAGIWTVKEVASHLLDGNLRTLSMLRDGYYGEAPSGVNSYQDMVGYLNGLNADWIKATRRLSPPLIITLLELSGKAYCEYLATLDLEAPAEWSVAWAGEEHSKNWFHIAREYTEKWHHQQQIRLAVGETDLLYQQKWYSPHLATSVQALPHHYRSIEAPEGTTIQLNIKGPFDDYTWYLSRERSQWVLLDTFSDTIQCTVNIPGSIAWRIFTKGIDQENAKKQSLIQGDDYLGNPIFSMLAVMAKHP